ncbi:hypothetical protein H8S90_15115 [Olivibacter sp. SDN3]|uniref:RipA family octameric membrane protein n=1 Tax=Olivibacter sp. SDN3 TaxID=2764720 RepID=UPI0016511B30|nr:hypothetical protein [Olivibacter sp. SDN3]QNL48134.1 hypothetical protein H8S90_15115 [Olivibacter sp. SDN3]
MDDQLLLQLFILTVIIFIVLMIACPPFRSLFYKEHPNELNPISAEEFVVRFEQKMPNGVLEKELRWKELLEKAWKVRDFEIELYWKRTNYFWLFQVPAFAAYFLVWKNDVSNDKPDELFVICCLGIVFSTGWLLINKGSKSWQRHWECYIDLLEDRYYGPLYKTVGLKSSYSVSKINEIVSCAFIFVWSLFAVKFMSENNITICLCSNSEKFKPFIAFTLFFTSITLLSMFKGYGRGYFKGRNITFYKRKVTYKKGDSE